MNAPAGPDAPRPDAPGPAGPDAPRPAAPAPDPVAALGLPAAGRGAPASWGARIAALLIDWAACLVVATGLFGTAVLWGSGWRLWMPLATYFVEKTVLTAAAGGSFGQLIAGVGIARLGGGRVGLARSAARAALVCLVIPAVAIGPARRGLHDVLLGTIAVKRR